MLIGQVFIAEAIKTCPIRAVEGIYVNLVGLTAAPYISSCLPGDRFPTLLRL